ncbi:hypothetical protein IE979_21830 [Klebsiella pneumoniae]|uniref:Uncharacterized protein n=1 Tax=Klebsiella pneumoniae TaxID=573 RepID=A0A927DRV1_KLEPN|nr:hypothetical protein [Klebsiella pneumoniae]
MVQLSLGDTAADYDSIRNYAGTATVRDVVGQHIAGRFVVNPDDTTSGEIPGGILVDVLGRRWYRRAEFVSYDMFMAPVFRCYAPCCAGRPGDGQPFIRDSIPVWC